MRLLCALVLFFSYSSMAEWQLDSSNSSLNFISTKNTHFSEMHSFDKFSGQISEQGKLSVTVNLASVNTLIEIRNTRMREILFKIDEFTTAELSAELPDIVANASVGEQNTIELEGKLDLHGTTSPINMLIRVARLDENTYTAHTVKPIILNASQFGLESGVSALQTIAGLSNISLAVPVTFSVTFKK